MNKIPETEIKIINRSREWFFFLGGQLVAVIFFMENDTMCFSPSSIIKKALLYTSLRVYECTSAFSRLVFGLWWVLKQSIETAIPLHRQSNRYESAIQMHMIYFVQNNYSISMKYIHNQHMFIYITGQNVLIFLYRLNLFLGWIVELNVCNKMR